MLRGIAALIASLMCAYAGLRLSARLKARAKTLRGALAAARSVLSGVKHTRLPLPALLRSCAVETCPVSLSLAAEGVEAGATPEEALHAAAYAARPYGFPELADGDREAVAAFLAALGAESRAAACERGALAIALLEERAREAEALYRQKGRVYRALGLLTGAAVAVLLL